MIVSPSSKINGFIGRCDVKGIPAVDPPQRDLPAG
jgi:hypothetical protein